MIALRDAVADYLTIRRALGFKLVEHQRLLYDFATFLEQAGASTITTELAVAWAVRCRGTEGWKAARLSVARGFASYLRTIDPAAEIPATGILIARKHYATPYLYSDQEIGRLLAAAAALRPPLRAASHYTLFGLIAVAGMRIGEALRLDRDDVDLDSGVLTIRNTKFGKSRQLPLHRSTTAALARYDRTRDELCPRPRSPTFFVSTRGNRMDKSAVQKAFRDLCRRSGPGSRARADRPSRGCTTSDMRLLCKHCSTGTAPASTCKPECCGCPPTWGTSSRPTPTAI
jgi:integrase/recombinase XerD